MQQKRQDNAQGEPTPPTPSTPTTTTTREGGQHPADPNDLGSPSDRSRGQTPDAHTPSPTHTVYSALRGATIRWHTGHYCSTTDTTRPQEGRATGEQLAQRQLMEPEPVHAPSQRTHYSARATDRTASTTLRQRTPSLDRMVYSTRNTDHSHILRRDTNNLDSPCNGSRGPAPGAHNPSPTQTVYSAQQEEPQPGHTTTQWHVDHCPRTTDTTGPHGERATGGRTAQRLLLPEPDHTPSQRTDYCGRATDRTTSTTPLRRTRSLDRTEYSTQNTDCCHTPRDKAQHHDDREKQRSTDTNHHYLRPREHPAPRLKSYPEYPALLKPRTHPRNQYPVGVISP